MIFTRTLALFALFWTEARSTAGVLSPFFRPVGRNDSNYNLGAAGVQRTVAATAVETTEVPRTAFDDERECSEANGGRPCVCRTQEFLKRTLSDSDATEGSAGCPSYGPVPKAFVFDSPDGGGGGITDGPAAEDVVGVGTEVDFDAAIGYRPDRKSDDGKISEVAPLFAGFRVRDSYRSTILFTKRFATPRTLWAILTHRVES